MVHARTPGGRRPRRPPEVYVYAFGIAGVLMAGAALGALLSDGPGGGPGGQRPGPAPVDGMEAPPTFGPGATATERPPRSPAVRGVRMNSPRPGQRVRGREGVLITGTAGELGGRRLRVFDLADNGLFYLVDRGGVAVRDGRWRLRYRDIGEGSDDVGHTFVLLAVTADGGCQRALRAARPNGEGDLPFRELPDGCRIEDRAPVRKVAP